MIAYKGFNKDLTCTMGRGTFQYEIGKTYTEESAKCANTGFHACENPIDVLSYYSKETDRYCICRTEGDINEDGNNKLSCTRLTIVKEISLTQLLMLGCDYIMKYPNRKNSSQVRCDEGYAHNGYSIVRGKNPIAQGRKGDRLILLKEKKKSKDIENIMIYLIDGAKVKEQTFYSVKGEVVDEKRSTKKAESA